MKTVKQRLQYGIDVRTKFYTYTSINVNWNDDNTVCLVKIAFRFIEV